MSSATNGSDGIPLFDLNPSLDRAALSARFAAQQRLQVRDLLSDQSARAILNILSRETNWGLAWQAANDGPHNIRREKIAQLSTVDRQTIGQKADAAMRARDYAFLYSQYPMLDAYLQKWAEGSPHDLLLEHINSPPFLELVREITGLPQLIKADAQATLYGPGQFLAMHDDSHVAEGWQVAYVLNFCPLDWRVDWGGYLMFYDDDGDVIAGFRPRFNALNLFRVPQKHNVTYVPPFAPVGRFAITGWFRNV